MLLGQVSKSQEEDHQIRRLKSLEAGDVGEVVGVDFALFIDGKKNRASEAMVPCHDFSKLGARLFGAVFLVATHEHNVFPHSDPALADKADPVSVILPCHSHGETVGGEG